MDFAERLFQLRRERGYSQEQLADMLDISRQAVSKWEAGQAMPDLPKLIALAEHFDVSLDSLVRPDAPCRAAGQPVVCRGCRVYEYKSKRRIFGVPLVHVHFAANSGGFKVAKGIIAVGNAAVGVVAIGGFSLGILSLGGIGAGLLTIGGLALGAVSIGGVSVGLLALGGCAFGVYAIGGAATASRLAIGGAAAAPASMGANADAGLQLGSGVTSEMKRAYLSAHAPEVPVWIRNLLSH